MGVKIKGIVVFQSSGGPLYLTEVKRNKDGTIRYGFVVNGGWYFEVINGECFAKADERIVNKWFLTEPLIEVPVPHTIEGGYNAVIEWAEKQINPGPSPNE